MSDKVNIPLLQFQEWMQQLLLDPFQQTEVNPSDILPDAFHTLEDVVHDSEKLAAKDHLAIYQRSYIARLRNCMATQFSALEYALGEDIFVESNTNIDQTERYRLVQAYFQLGKAYYEKEDYFDG